MKEKLKTVGDYKFDFICEIQPQRNEKGEVYTYNPSKDYDNKKNVSLNKYGDREFCDFVVKTDRNESGVYALYFDEKLVYIGKAKDFKQRWSQVNYCHISPRNCFVGGQSTNCHINSEICKQTKANNKVYLYFFATPKYSEVEKELICKRNPELNVALNCK